MRRRGYAGLASSVLLRFTVNVLSWLTWPDEEASLHCAGFSWRESGISFSEFVDIARMFFSSLEVANLPLLTMMWHRASPLLGWLAGSSQSFIVFFITSASCELGFTENLFKISPSFFDEKGIDSATLRDKKVALFEVLKKCNFIFEP